MHIQKCPGRGHKIQNGRHTINGILYINICTCLENNWYTYIMIWVCVTKFDFFSVTCIILRGLGQFFVGIEC